VSAILTEKRIENQILQIFWLKLKKYGFYEWMIRWF